MANILEEVRKVNEADALALRNFLTQGQLVTGTNNVIPNDDQASLLGRTEIRLQDSGCRSMVILATSVSPDIPNRPEDDPDRPPLPDDDDDDLTTTPEPNMEDDPKDDSSMILWILGGLVAVVCWLVLLFFFMSSIY